MAESSKPGKESTKSLSSIASRPSSLVSSSSASAIPSLATRASSRPPISKTTSSAAVLERTVQPVSKPIIQVESTTIEFDEEDDGFDGLDDDEADNDGMMEVDENDRSPAGQYHEADVFDDCEGEGFESDEGEEMEDPEDWTRLTPESKLEVQSILSDIKASFADEVDEWDTTMVAEYADDIFTYMEELEVSPFTRFSLPLTDNALSLSRSRPCRTHATWTFRTRSSGTPALPTVRPAIPSSAHSWPILTLSQADANDPHRLAPASSPPVPHASGDALDRRQHRRSLPLGSRRLARQASTRRSHRHVHRGQVRGDSCAEVRCRAPPSQRSLGIGLTRFALSLSVDEFVYMTENGYTKEEILKGERIVLQVCPPPSLLGLHPCQRF